MDSRPSSSGYQRSEGSDSREFDSGDEALRKQTGGGANAAGTGAGYRELWQRVSRVNPGESNAIVSDCTVEDMLRTIKTLQNKQSALDVVRAGLHYLDSRALAFLLKELGKCKLTHRAFEIFDWLHVHPDPSLAALCDVFTYTTVISLCGSPRLLWKALRLVGCMKSKGIPCNTHTYSALISVCVKAKQPGLALDVYQEMKRSGCKPSVVTYNTLVDAYGKAGLWHEAVSVLDTMISENIAPEARTINSVIRDCCECGQPDAGYKVFTRFRGVGLMPTTATFNHLINAYCDIGQAGEAYRLLEEQVACGVERTPSTYSHMLEYVERNGATANPLLLPLLQHMQADGLSLEQVRRAKMPASERGGGRQRQQHHSPTQRPLVDASLFGPRQVGSFSPQQQQAAIPQHMNFQELLQLAQQQPAPPAPPAPIPMQPLLAPGVHMGRGDMLSQHATAQALGLTMTLPDVQSHDSWATSTTLSPMSGYSQHLVGHAPLYHQTQAGSNTAPLFNPNTASTAAEPHVNALLMGAAEGPQTSPPQVQQRPQQQDTSPRLL